MKPRRIQRKRTKGWKMPPNTKYIGRPGKWGNPLEWATVKEFRRCLRDGAYARRSYNYEIAWAFRVMRESIHELRGFNLCCYCKLSDPCHGEPLLELANEEPPK